MWTERGQACVIFIFRATTNCEKTWPNNLLDMRPGQLKVPQKLPQGQLACGRQAFTATLLFDPSMSALPIFVIQKSQSVGLFTRQ